MTPAELADINRRMAEAQGWRYLKGPTEAAGWFWFDREQTRALTHPPAYATDPALTMPLMEAEPCLHMIMPHEGMKCVSLGHSAWSEYRGDGPTILIAYCLAYLARHDARKGEG